jgi:RNA polymerase sigma-70 factor (ECF subfamily)
VSDIECFNQYRPVLFAIAYRMLGSVMDAEDVVQETFVRWQQTSQKEVRSPRAFLTTIVTRLCINHLQSAQVMRQEYIGPWLPEPIVTEPGADPENAAELADSLSMAFLLLLRTLSPTERAIFLLREVFEYDYADIARIVGKSEANCRQILRRARRYIAARRPRFEASPQQQQKLMEKFAQACVEGDMEELLALLAEEVTLYVDSGGKVPAARRPIHRAQNVARFMLGIVRKAPPDFLPRFTEINGRPGIIGYAESRPFSTLTLEVADGTIQAIYIVVNPEKLRTLTPLIRSL